MNIDTLSLTKRRKQYLETMNLHTFEDIVLYLPSKYENLKVTDINRSYDNKKVVIIGKVIGEPKVSLLRKNFSKLEFYIESNNDLYKIIIFNREYLKNTLLIDKIIKISGKFNYYKKEIVASNIYFDINEDVLVTYKLNEGMKSKEFNKIVNMALTKLENENLNVVPKFYINKYKLKDKLECLKLAHNPKSENEIKFAYRHLKYEELLEFTTSMEINKRILKQTNKIGGKIIDYKVIDEFTNKLPYTPTSSQIEAIKEIFIDLESKGRMYRILQGDVGSGKTLVSLISMLAVYTNKEQSALMAPTDLLARQHYENIVKLTKGMNINIKLLVGAMSIKEKNEIKKMLKDGEIDMVIGTHALIQKDVKFKNLGLVVIDEQHRFGVAQRISLKEKGENTDLLLMSATPIPRTLAQTIYGDLDISSLEGFPSGERKIKTKLIKDNEDILEIVKEKLISGEKIFVVCPLIEDNDTSNKDVTSIYKEYKKEFSSYGVGYLHGKMSEEDKIEVLNNFSIGKIKVLVSTTVVEVGIDIRDARVMVIYGANNFGMAQLHQLRGRIGRDGKIGYCYLLTESEDENATEKLKYFSSCNDGYKISEYDMKNRGIGELIGIKQSGLPTNFMYSNLINDYAILDTARKDAKYILNNLHLKEFKNYFTLVNSKTRKNIAVLN